MGTIVHPRSPPTDGGQAEKEVEAYEIAAAALWPKRAIVHAIPTGLGQPASGKKDSSGDSYGCERCGKRNKKLVVRSNVSYIIWTL